MNKKKIIVSSLMTLLAAGLTGSIMGTVAWYSYSNRAVAEFTGTSVNTSKNLWVGIYNNNTDITMPTGFTADTTDTKAYFTADHSLSMAEIKSYLDLTYYAKDQALSPVSAGPVAEGDAMEKLYEPYGGEDAVEATLPTAAVAPAEQEYAEFVVIPLVLKIVDEEKSTESTEVLVKNPEIYLTAMEAVAKTDEDGDLYKGLRVNLEGDEEYLVNPSATADGSIDVAGTLDLDFDGYYDFEGNSFSWTEDKGKEKVFGWTNGDPSFAPEALAAESALTDTTKAASVHNAKHAKGVHQATFTAEKQNYVGTNTVVSDFDYEANKFYVTGTDTEAEPFVTGGTNGYAFVTATIWLEGWDTNVIDVNQPYAYNLGLQFECAYGL